MLAPSRRCCGEHLPTTTSWPATPIGWPIPRWPADLRGYLTGSLDLVLRFPDTDGQARFAVVDYKTNWLAPPARP